MKVIPLIAVAACALGLAACVRPVGYAGAYVYSERFHVESDRGYDGYRRDRSGYYERSRYDDRRRERDWRRAERRDDRDWDGDRRRYDDRYRY